MHAVPRQHDLPERCAEQLHEQRGLRRRHLDQVHVQRWFLQRRVGRRPVHAVPRRHLLHGRHSQHRLHDQRVQLPPSTVIDVVHVQRRLCREFPFGYPTVLPHMPYAETVATGYQQQRMHFVRAELVVRQRCAAVLPLRQRAVSSWQRRGHGVPVQFGLHGKS